MKASHLTTWLALALLPACLTTAPAAAQPKTSALPVRGFCISAPSAQGVDRFVRFIEEELAPRSVNTLILRVDYNFQYASHPELRDRSGLTTNDVSKLVEACRKHGIRVVPQVNLLGHQSWASQTGSLLRVYPEFDETPWVKMPAKHTWPNPDRLYCKSYCPLHPKVHDVVFDLMDELCDAFGAKDFHAGMDEVFYIGEDKCPRCGGKDKAELFANEVRLIRDRLALKDRKLWIWGDRLIDGKTTGMGEWEAAINGTHRAVDLIPKDVVICDWHYERADTTAVYFAMKGLSVAACPWNNAQAGVNQVRDMRLFRDRATPALRPRYLGVVQTVWSDSRSFIESCAAARAAGTNAPAKSPAGCFMAVFDEINKTQ